MPFIGVEIRTPLLDLNTGFDSSATIGEVKNRVIESLNESDPGYDFFSDEPAPEIYKVANFPNLAFPTVDSVLSDRATLAGSGIKADDTLRLAGPLPAV